MKKILLPAFLIIISLSFSHGQDGYLTGLSLNRYIKTSQNYSIKVNVRNTTSTPITTCTVSWQLNNGTVTSHTVNIGGGGITTNTYLPYTLPSSLNVSSLGAAQFKIWVTVAGDINNANDTIKKEIVAIANYVDNKVLIENYTATSCPACPTANTVLNQIASNPNFLVAKFFANTYNTTAGSSYMSSYFASSGFTPATVMNMGEFGTYDINAASGLWADEANRRIGIAPASVTVNATFDPISRDLSTEVKVNFAEPLSGDFYINAYIIQNNISGTQSGVSGTYLHQHVVRSMLGGSNGNGSIIPSNPVVGTDYIFTNTTTLPAQWEIQNIHVIGYAFEKEGSLRYTINADKWSYSQANINEIETVDIFSVYPNPANYIININTAEFNGNINFNIEIFDINGKLMLTNKLTDFNNQYNIKNFPNGTYMIKIFNQNTISNLRFIKQ